MLDHLVSQGNGYLLTSQVLLSGVSKPTLAEYVRWRQHQSTDAHPEFHHGAFSGANCSLTLSRQPYSKGRHACRLHQVAGLEQILHTIEQDETMQSLWERYRDESFFVGELTWAVVVGSVK